MGNKNLNINFLLICKNGENEVDFNYNINQLFSHIRNYVIDYRYIKIKNKPIIGIDDEIIKENDIYKLRQIFRNNKLGEIFILSNANDENIQNKANKNLFDGLYYSTHYNSLEKTYFNFNKSFGYFYTHLLYHNLFLRFPNNKTIFRTSEAMSRYPIYLKEKKTYIYGDYSPEKFYFLNKIIFNWTLENHKKGSRFIFINNYYILEPNNLFDDANLNYFSKALYELPILNNNFKLINLQKKALISIQIHIYFIDLLAEAINKTNNIPVSFDLYITTNNVRKKNYIENYLKLNSRANKYLILITPNKGRDILPFLLQFKDILRNYKYICHIHTKKHKKSSKLGAHWRIYLYENLLGNSNIISQIINDFEINNKLGLIFPEPFYLVIKLVYYKNKNNVKQLNKLVNILFPKLNIKLKNEFNFPAGNMFWARTSAIYQIFNEKIIQSTPKEKGQFDGTLLHGIERFWPFLVKLNGFYYKTILYSI